MIVNPSGIRSKGIVSNKILELYYVGLSTDIKVRGNSTYNLKVTIESVILNRKTT